MLLEMVQLEVLEVVLVEQYFCFCIHWILATLRFFLVSEDMVVVWGVVEVVVGGFTFIGQTFLQEMSTSPLLV